MKIVGFILSGRQILQALILAPFLILEVVHIGDLHVKIVGGGFVDTVAANPYHSNLYPKPFPNPSPK